MRLSSVLAVPRRASLAATLLGTLLAAPAPAQEMPPCPLDETLFRAVSWGDFRPQVAFWRAAEGLGALPEPAEPDDAPAPDAAGAWAERIAALGLPPDAPADPWWDPCNRGVAVDRLDALIDELGADHPYVREWAANQQVVFLNCAPGNDVPLALPALKGRYDEAVQTLAEAATAYQQASAFFYHRNFGEAFTLYAEIAREPASPYRYLAVYMAARSILNAATGWPQPDDPAGKLAQADALLQALRDDPEAAEVHAIAAELQGAVAWHAQDAALLAGQFGRMVAVLGRPQADIEADPAGPAAYRQAVDDLHAFIHPVWSFAEDWWLHPPEADPGFMAANPRATAVARAAAGSDLVDWLQATAKSARLHNQWLEAMSEPVRSPAYDAATTHVLARWRATGALPWLVTAAMRVVPGDEGAAEVLDAVRVALYRQPACGEDMVRDPAAQAYPILVFHAVRLMLAGGDIEGAFRLLESLTGTEDWIAETDTQALRWLVATGQIDLARRLDALIGDRWLDLWSGPNTLRQVIATDLAHLVHVQGGQRIGPGLGTLIDLLPVRVMLDVAGQEGLAPEDRLRLARVAWTRATLLGDDAQLARATPLLRSLSPEFDADYAEAENAWFDATRERLLAHVMLKSPRLGIRFSSDDFYLEERPYLIDDYNPGDNNWWCRFDDGALRARLATTFYDEAFRFDLAGTVPVADQVAFRLVRDRLLERHLLVAQIDGAELARLAAVDNAPRVLGARAIAWAEDMGWLGRLLGRDERLPEALADTVRATRYGCPRDAAYGDISRRAFDLLHARYGDTEWAARTPYWFAERPWPRR